ncbi:MAG: ferrochelatase [Deltaproteobacteria bacterium]|nr:ferrochelatase [Deltaproteobacteria bacterium]
MSKDNSQKQSDSTIGVVLFNFGAPRDLDDIYDFQVRLFSDPDVFGLPIPQFCLNMLARIIASVRTTKTRAKYERIDGISPLLKISEQQRDLLQADLGNSGLKAKVVLAMRYSYPGIEDALSELKKEGVNRVIFLPLFPQYSLATTENFYKALHHTLKKYSFSAEFIHDYHLHPNFIEAWTERIKELIRGIDISNHHLLFSAHGLPMKILKLGDPYKEQIEAGAAAIYEQSHLPVPYSVSYQSRTGPVEWIGPDTLSVVKDLAQAGKGIILVPLSFVSDNFETNYENDIEQKEIFIEHGGRNLIRVPALNESPKFIRCLRNIIIEHARENRYS